MENEEIANECYVCKKTCKSVLSHVAKAKKCQEKYPKHLLDQLRSNSRKKRIQYVAEQNKKDYAENRSERIKRRKVAYEENKPKEQATMSAYYVKNAPERKSKAKENYVKTAPERKSKAKEYYAKTAAQKKSRAKANYAKNKPLRKRQMKDNYIKVKAQICKDFPSKLKSFFKEIQHGPVYPCVCCNRDMFKRGVKKVTRAFLSILKKNDLESCVKLNSSLLIDGHYYICSSCHSTLKNKKKMPNICFQNGLDVSEVPDCLKLTDLENQLISKNLIFIKVFPSPRSRYAVMHDRIVNVPIPDDDVIKTVETLPRNDDSSGLIKVQLKRKLEFQAHKEEMIRPDMLTDAVNYLKVHHPSYEDIVVNNQTGDDNEQTEEINQTLPSTDPLADANFYADCEMSSDSDNEPSTESDNDQLSDSDNEVDDSPYNNITCLVPDEPQTRMLINTSDKTIHKKKKANSKISHAIAPGEGKCISNWMRDENFDIDAFPIHHGDGKYGLNYERDIKIQPYQFFGQRAMHHDKRWSTDLSYLFVGQQYVERFALEREINLSMTRGNMKTTDDKSRVIPLENPINILKKIPGTPSYWKTFKNDILAKIEQHGHFHFFFTLSCAERKWPEVFSAILQQEGSTITFENMPWDGNESSILVDGEPLSEIRKRVDLPDKLRKHIFLVTRMFHNRVKAFVKNILKKSGIDLYAYRVEWQIRGMPHIHGVAWLKKYIIEKFLDSSGVLKCNEKLIEELIDKWISVSLTNKDERLNALVKEVNCHTPNHTKSCKKYNTTCRFGFPKFPSNKTYLTQPHYDDLEEDEKKKKIEEAKQTLAKVKEKLENLTEKEEQQSIKEFLDSIGIDEDEYYKALTLSIRGTSIVLKRSLQERYVNNYNPEFMVAWQGNMDIQFCTDVYAIVTYITDYLTKPDRGFEKLLETALKHKGDCHDFQRLNEVKRIYFTHRQINVSEAIYRLLPTLNMKDSNQKTRFVTSGLPEKRSVMFLPKSEDNQEEENEINEDEDNLYEIDGRQKKYKKVRTIHEHYADRPECLENICLAKFATIYETVAKPKTVVFENNISNSNDDMITAYGEQIPKWILMTNGICMKARSSSAGLRIHSSKKKKNYEEQYAELLLFYPWRNEYELNPEDGEKVIELFNDKLEIILQNRKDVLPYSSMVAEMKQYLEHPAEMRPANLFDTLDSSLEQANEDDDELKEEIDETPVIAEEDNNLHQNKSKADMAKFKIPQVDDDESMRKMARGLSKEQRMVLDTIVDYLKKLVASRKYISSDFSPPQIIVHGKSFS